MNIRKYKRTNKMFSFLLFTIVKIKNGKQRDINRIILIFISEKNKLTKQNINIYQIKFTIAEV